jgi:hypothetical protein
MNAADFNELKSHFYECQQCGEMVDMRQLDDVLFHEDPSPQAGYSIWRIRRNLNRVSTNAVTCFLPRGDQAPSSSAAREGNTSLPSLFYGNSGTKFPKLTTGDGSLLFFDTERI